MGLRSGSKLNNTLSEKEDMNLNCYTKSFLINSFKRMVQIRKFEERVAELIAQNKIKCPCHLYTGQEAVATGVCSALSDTDCVFSTHRSHGHYLAKGGNLNRLMAELFGKETGCSRGHGGSMHLAEPEKGLPGSSAIVAGTISLAVGAGLAFSIQKKDSVSVAFFGDGATNEGNFYESLNFASLHKLPVLFVCENNLYSTHMPIENCLANTKIFEVAKAMKLSSKRVDGNNFLEVYNAAKTAIEDIRSGNGPVFLECLTYRWLGHVGPNDDIDKGLRNRAELDLWKSRCPIKQFGEYLQTKGIFSADDRRAIYDQIDREINSSLTFAEESLFPVEPVPESRRVTSVYKEG